MIGKPEEAPKFYKKYLLERGLKINVKRLLTFFFYLIENDSPIPKLPDNLNLRVEVFTVEDTFLESLDSKIEEKVRKRVLINV